MATPRKTQESSYAEKKQALTGNKLIRRPIPRIPNDIVANTSGHLKKKQGQVKTFTPIKMRNGINRYFKFCEENDEMPSIKGLMIFLKTYKEAFYTYLKYPEFTDMLEHTRMIIANWAETDVYNTPGQAAGKIAYMKNLHGWSDKIDTTATVVKIEMTPDEARARIERLAPKLLEVLQNSQVLSQITTRPQDNKKIIDAEEA